MRRKRARVRRPGGEARGTRAGAIPVLPRKDRGRGHHAADRAANHLVVRRRMPHRHAAAVHRAIRGRSRRSADRAADKRQRQQDHEEQPNHGASISLIPQAHKFNRRSGARGDRHRVGVPIERSPGLAPPPPLSGSTTSSLRPSLPSAHRPDFNRKQSSRPSRLDYARSRDLFRANPTPSAINARSWARTT